MSAPAEYVKSSNEYEIPISAFKKAYDTATGEFHVKLSDAISQVTFLNKKIYFGSLSIEKVNADGKELPYIQFNLRGVDTEGQEIYSRVQSTGVDGRTVWRNLPEGEYTLTEIVRPGLTGYQPIVDRTFRVTKDNLDHAFVGENALVNQDVQVVIKKLAVAAGFDLETALSQITEFGEISLNGYQFEIRAIDDAGEPTGPVITTGLTSDGVIIVEGLEVNTIYQITEVERPDTIYQHNPETYYFMINDQGRLVDPDGTIFRQDLINFPNPLKPVFGRVEVVKQDDAGNALEGAEFGIFRVTMDGTSTVPTSTVVATVTADGRAVAIFEDIAPGSYVLKEISAPLGYAPSYAEHSFTIPVTPTNSMLTNPNYDVEADRIVRNFSYEYINIPLVIEVLKGDDQIVGLELAEAINYVQENPGYAYRQTGPNRATVYLPLEGVVFDLYEQLTNGTLSASLGQFVSDAQGEVQFGDFIFDASKKYQLIETATIEGYQLDQQPIRLAISDEAKRTDFDGSVKRYKNNHPILGRVIISKYDEDERIALAGATFALFAENSETGAFDVLVSEQVTPESGLIEFRELELGRYRLVEVSPPPGYQDRFWQQEITVTETATSFSFVVNNPRAVQFSITKDWVNSDPATSEIEVEVLADGETAYDLDGNVVANIFLNTENYWTQTVTNLPKYRQVGDAWERIVYSIRELTELEGFTVRIAGSSDYESQAYTIYNVKDEGDKTSIGVTKRWPDGSPQPVLITVYANRLPTQHSITLTAEMGWHYLFTDLAKFDDKGVEIVYTVVEAVPEGYTAEYTGTAELGFEIINETIPTEPPTTESTPTESAPTEPPLTESTPTESTTTEPPPSEPTTTEPTTTPTVPTTAPTVPTTTPPSPIARTGEYSIATYGIGFLTLAAALAFIAWHQRRREEE